MTDGKRLGFYVVARDGKRLDGSPLWAPKNIQTGKKARQYTSKSRAQKEADRLNKELGK